MAYNRRNYIQKRKHAVQIANSYYEPGRHDRCYRWVWRKYIRDTFHVDYMTFMRWLREERQTQRRLHSRIVLCSTKQPTVLNKKSDLFEIILLFSKKDVYICITKLQNGTIMKTPISISEIS